MITIRPGAVLDEKQQRVIYKIQQHTLGHMLTVTRGHSTPLEQLQTIADFALRHNVRFHEFDAENFAPEDLHRTVEIDGQHRYCWQQTWSRLLHLGIVVNPPLVAECLEDYINDQGYNRKGESIQPSPHILSDPIDFSARIDGAPNMPKVIELLTTAMNNGAGIRFVKPEPKNGCVHIDLERQL